MNVSNYVSKYQYGFLPGRSTQLALFDILKDLHTAKNSSKYRVIISRCTEGF